ncbi:MAG TPA: serine/threonine protein kinase, partial [Planctomycetes bacterium]|nr:serine/threonine protein kinase [Planctomycetota bacterium]
MQVGPYEVLSELGRGGMGVVYRARDPRLDREVALKLLLPLADPEERLRFQREAEAAGALRHPALLKVHEAGFERGRPYLVTALAQGSLADELRRGPLAPRRAAELVAQLAHGLELAHAQGILHRDIKPANVLLDEEGRPLLADFGLARRLQDETLTATGGVLGTPAYMAPEQARGERTDARSDVYGLGA